jgi:hypothetical protein
VQPWPYQNGKTAVDFKIPKTEPIRQHYQLRGFSSRTQSEMSRAAATAEACISSRSCEIILPKVYSTTAARIISEHNLQEELFTQKKIK